jgi:hypothetical protein
VNVVKQYKKVGSIFTKTLPFAPGSTPKVTGGVVSPYHITTANQSGSGASRTIDILVDGANVTVTDESTGGSSSSTGLHCDGRSYKITSGNLTDVEFILDQSVTNSSTANILVFAPADLQIAPDVSGVAGTYGITDVTLTESGQSSGVITASGAAYFWERTLVPFTANTASNPYQMDVALIGSVTGAAGWAA